MLNKTNSNSYMLIPSPHTYKYLSFISLNYQSTHHTYIQYTLFLNRRIMSHSWQYTPKQYSKDLLVRHMASSHHPQDLYKQIQTDFVKKIQVNNNPSLDYFQKMKGLYMDQLDSGIHEYNNKKNKWNRQMEETRRDYNENTNGLVLYLEKEESKRDQFIRNCLNKQESRAKKYVDIYGTKMSKADQLIEKNCQNQLSLVKQQLYLTEKRKNLQASQDRHSENCSQLSAYEQIDPNYNVLSSMTTRNSHYLHPDDSMGTSQNKQNIHKIKSHMRRKTQGEEEDEIYETSHKRVYKLHNPITNPIEYHIDNPYFLKKLQAKYGNS